MSVEAIILRSIKESVFGVRFTQTVEQILITITGRILVEDIDGCRFLEKVGAILHHYIEFNLMEAIQTYVSLRPVLEDFVSTLRYNQENTTNRARTWDKIMGILDILLSDGCRFLGIAADEMGKIRRI
jgi:hypothetical protein